MEAMRFLATGSSIKESVGSSAVLRTGFFGSFFSGVFEAVETSEAWCLPLAEDFEAPRGPVKGTARGAREEDLEVSIFPLQHTP